MKLTGRNGVLRIMDGAALPITSAPLSQTAYIHTMTGMSLTDRSGALGTLNGSGVDAIVEASADLVYVGSAGKFAMVRYAKAAGQNYGAGTGALVAKYWNGSTWASLEGVVDGTASGGNCFAQDGYITFKIPRNWGTDEPYLDSGIYYVSLQTTSNPSTDPGADILCPCLSQYFEVAFASMDFSGPMGRQLQEEILVLDRNTMSAKGHYIKSADDPLYEPIPISFSAMIDDTYNKDAIMEALACGTPGSTYWTGAGTTSKGTTKNNGVHYNPGFADTNKKCVNAQILWSGATYGIGMAFYECYFPADEITIAESEDAITLSANGGCYGVIETISGFGNRY